MDPVQVPLRSISLPSRLHPTSMKIEANLTKLKTWGSFSSSTRTSPLVAETVKMGLKRLAELFNCIEELIHSPISQQGGSHQRSDLVERALEGSVGLIDVCSNARDLLLIMDQHVHDLQSALRRRGRDSSSIETDILRFISFRKKVKKEISKQFKELKRVQTKFVGSSSSNAIFVHDHLSLIIEIVREASDIAISVFKSLLLFISSPTYINTSGWSSISKAIRTGFFASDDHKHRDQRSFNEVESVDIGLCTLQDQIKNNLDYFDVKQLQKRLDMLDVCLKGLEHDLGHLFRCLIQNRASLLNLVTL